MAEGLSSRTRTRSCRSRVMARRITGAAFAERCHFWPWFCRHNADGAPLHTTKLLRKQATDSGDIKAKNIVCTNGSERRSLSRFPRPGKAEKWWRITKSKSRSMKPTRKISEQSQELERARHLWPSGRPLRGGEVLLEVGLVICSDHPLTNKRAFCSWG